MSTEFIFAVVFVLVPIMLFAFFVGRLATARGAVDDIARAAARLGANTRDGDIPGVSPAQWAEGAATCTLAFESSISSNPFCSTTTFSKSKSVVCANDPASMATATLVNISPGVQGIRVNVRCDVPVNSLGMPGPGVVTIESNFTEPIDRWRR
jgi:hypothetical protein